MEEILKINRRRILPWLMLTRRRTMAKTETPKGFLVFTKTRYWRLNCRGSERRDVVGYTSWLVGDNWSIFEQFGNSLTRVQIPLPPSLLFPSDRQYLIDLNPNSPSCVVVLIYSEVWTLGFARLGDRAWTPIEFTE